MAVAGGQWHRYQLWRRQWWKLCLPLFPLSPPFCSPIVSPFRDDYSSAYCPSRGHSCGIRSPIPHLALVIATQSMLPVKRLPAAPALPAMGMCTLWEPDASSVCLSLLCRRGLHGAAMLCMIFAWLHVSHGNDFSNITTLHIYTHKNSYTFQPEHHSKPIILYRMLHITVYSILVAASSVGGAPHARVYQNA